MSLVRRFPIIVKKPVTETEFVEFWASRYVNPRDHLYSRNIDKPLTARRLLALFKWKNGGPIAAHKRASIRRHYIDAKPLHPKPNDREAHVRFIAQPGGAIWRIFWLHCKDPAGYPIFDQNVFRAMKNLV